MMVALVAVVRGRNASEDAAGLANQRAQKLAAFNRLALKTKKRTRLKVDR